MQQAARVAVIIPAYNEAATVGAVVAASRAASLVDEVIVVDDGSADDTVAVASAAGARAIRNEHRGKGEAMLAGGRASDGEVLVFLDADLTGLRPHHVDRLAATVLRGEAAMAVGIFDRGRYLNPIFLRLLPRLSGERALRRELLLSLDPANVRGYRVEAALNSHVARHPGGVRAFVLDGVFHRTKEQKESRAVVGFLHKLGMLSLAMWEYLAYWLREGTRRFAHRRGRSPTTADRGQER